jgi:hypothetical protein
MSRAVIAVAILIIFFIAACQKKDSSSPSALAISTSNNDLVTGQLSYGDSIFYTSVTGTDKRVYPVSRPADSGYFASSLPGLDLDSLTGRINITKSESGLRYVVYFLSYNNQPLDSTVVIISGIDYADHVYNVGSGAPEDQFALPVYNMAPGLPIPCSDSSGRGCKFDETDFNDDSIEDIPGANRNKLIVDKNNGTIDLAKSFEAGVFGQYLFNGRKKDVSIYYRLNDGSSRTLNKITIRLVYFRSAAMIPESMMLEINSRNQRYQQNGPTTETQFGTLLYYTTYSRPKRPPLIVIVSSY